MFGISGLSDISDKTTVVEVMQVKSRKRVQEHGEVFTNEREVNAMLDMVAAEAARIESRFLEPACGDGNFLVEILRRKLETVTGHHGRGVDDWCHYAWLAVSSVYGVELLADNAEQCRQRLYTFVLNTHPFACDQRFRESVRFLLAKNVICGDALTMLDFERKPLTFCEWSFVRGERVKRRDYQLSHMFGASEKSGDQLELFSLVGQSGFDVSRTELVPRAIREYPLRNWWEVAKDG